MSKKTKRSSRRRRRSRSRSRSRSRRTRKHMRSQSILIFSNPPKKQSLKILVDSGDNKQFGSLIPGLRDL